MAAAAELQNFFAAKEAAAILTHWGRGIEVKSNSE